MSFQQPLRSTHLQLFLAFIIPYCDGCFPLGAILGLVSHTVTCQMCSFHIFDSFCFPIHLIQENCCAKFTSLCALISGRINVSTNQPCTNVRNRMHDLCVCGSLHELHILFSLYVMVICSQKLVYFDSCILLLLSCSVFNGIIMLSNMFFFNVLGLTLFLLGPYILLST